MGDHKVQGSIPAQNIWVFHRGLHNPNPTVGIWAGGFGRFYLRPGDPPPCRKTAENTCGGLGASPRTKVEGAVPSGRNGTRIYGDTGESICIDSEWLWSLYDSDRLPGLIVYGSIAPSGLICSTLALYTACSHAVILPGR